MLMANSPIKKLTVSKDELEADICKQSFYDFLLSFWDEVISEPLVNNWHIKYLCDELQVVAERVFRREFKPYDLIINISPASTKSTICSVMFPIWCWVNDPTFRMICGSYAHPLSLYLASQSLRILQSDKFRRLFPHVQLKRDAVNMLTTTKGGWRYATSVGGSVTGLHAHIKLVDDPIDPKGAISDAKLKAANEWMDRTLSSRNVDKRITPTILIMQRLHQIDPTGNMLEKEESTTAKVTPVRHICLPATNEYEIKPRRLRRFYVDGLFDPVRLPRPTLDEERSKDEYAYAGQYGQKPVPLGGGMFRVSEIQIVKTAPTMWKVIRYWDKAGSAGKGAFTVGVKMGIDRDRNYWILDVVRGQWEAYERERIIKNTAIVDGKGIRIGIEQEPGSGGKESAQATLKNLAGWRVYKDRPVGDKELRADPFSTQVNGGNVKIVAGPWVAAYLAELQFFPHSKFKDQVDASSGAFAMLTKGALSVGAF